MGIPNYPEMRPLRLSDADIFKKFLSKRPLPICDHLFSNYYMWRLADKTEITMINGNLCCIVTAPDKKRYFMMPFGDNEIEKTLETCLSYSSFVVRADGDFVESYVDGSGKFKAGEDRDNFDYVYLTKDLVELKGKKYDGKRNHINAFLKKNAYTYEELEEAHVKDCLALNDKWCKEKTGESEAFPNIECEGDVVKEALVNFKYLKLKGGIIRVNGNIEAFAIGEMLLHDTAVIHIEKADPRTRGMSQLINREFARNAWADTTYINREQDMGHPGLRKAKLSYHPVKLEKKFNIRLV